MLSLEPADSLHKKRFYTATAFGATAYTGAMIGLQKAWYADFEQSSFHLFNDNHEWMQMDKMGHWFTTYQDARLVASGARWAGIKRKNAAWIGFGAGQLFQTSFEVLDGFSAEWGFSPGDVVFNTLGASMFVAQEYAWQEQRILMKMSGSPVQYPSTPIISMDGMSQTTLKQRAADLYGTGPINLFLKNYNTLVIWTSGNIHSFLPNKETSRFPKWLNVAVGMGADNIFVGSNKADEGFGYTWTDDAGATYSIDRTLYPRTRQFYLSLDVDLTRIKTKSRFLKSLLFALNVFKFPAPALQVNSQGGVQFHPFFF